MEYPPELGRAGGDRVGVLRDDVSAVDLGAGRGGRLASVLRFPRVYGGAEVFQRSSDGAMRRVTRQRLAPLADRMDSAMLGRMRKALGPHLRRALHVSGLPLGRRATGRRDLEAARAWIRKLYQDLDQDPARLLRWMRRRALQEPRVPPASLYVEAVEDPGELWVERYHRLLQAALELRPERVQAEARLLVGERLLTLMVDEDRQARYRSLIRGPAGIPLMAAACESAWQGLSGTGWRLWRAEALAALRRRSEAGHEVVYVAGGTDVYTLLRHGIRRIRVIDPIFPVQRPFYCHGWRFLLRGRFRDGGIGDQIIVRPGASPAGSGGAREGATTGGEAATGEPLVLTRVAFRERGTLDAGTMNDGSRCRLPRSVTRWRVESAAGGPPGYLVFERRFVTQDDFARHPRRALLISFNELYYVISPRDDGWGIDPRRFDAGLQIHVKQLRRPLDRAELLRLRGVLAAERYRCVMGTEVR